jgi:hypothetical protein
MLDKEIAIKVKERSLNAIREMSMMLTDIQGRCDEEDFEAIKRGAGLTMGRIQMELLEYVNSQFPDLDDLKDVTYTEQ